MFELTGHKIDKLPFPELERFYDIVFFDGPVLLHLVDNKKRNYFQYWVDFSENFDRCLIWRVKDELLYKYIKGRISLYEVITSPSKDFVFSVDIYPDNRFENIYALELEDIPTEYLPDEASFFQYERIPSVYEKLFNYSGGDFYIEILRESSINFKVNALESKYVSTVGISAVSDFLNKLQTSYLNFTKIDFYKVFNELTSDVQRLNKTYKALKPNFDLRIVDVSYGSFEVALSSDKTFAKGEPVYKEWQWKIFNKYSNDVIELDYDSEENLQDIIEKYTEDERRQIYKPYLNILSNNLYRVQVANKSKNFVKTYKPPNKTIINELIPEEIDEPSEEVEKEIRIAVYESSKDREYIDLREFKSNLFFTEPAMDEVPRHFNEIEVDAGKIYFKEPLICKFTKAGSRYRLYNEDFEISYESKEKDEITPGFFNKFFEFYLNLIEDTAPEKQEIKSKLQQKIERVERAQ